MNFIVTGLPECKIGQQYFSIFFFMIHFCFPFLDTKLRLNCLWDIETGLVKSNTVNLRAHVVIWLLFFFDRLQETSPYMRAPTSLTLHFLCFFSLLFFLCVSTCDWEISYWDSEKWWSALIAPQLSLLGQSPGDSILQQHVSEQSLNLGLLLPLPLNGLGQPSGVGESLLLRCVGSGTAHLVAMQQSTQQYLFFPSSAPLWAAIGKLLNIWSCKGEAAAQSSKFPEELLSGLQQGCRWRVEALFPSLVNKMTQTFQFRNRRTLSGNTFFMYDKTFSFSTQSLVNIATFRAWRTANTIVNSCWNRNV